MRASSFKEKDWSAIGARQEWCSAISELILGVYVCAHGASLMLAPTTSSVCRWRLGLVVLGAGQQFPFSTVYHGRLAAGLDTKVVDNRWRRLDQATINSACVVYALGISGSYLWGVLSLTMKVSHIREIWDNSTTTSARRRSHIFVGVLMYLSPLAWYGAWEKFSLAMACFACGIGAFALNNHLRGYGNGVFHCFMIPMHWCILTFVASHPISAPSTAAVAA